MTTAQQKWQQVYKRSPQARQKLAKDLSQFLQTLDNPHAFALLGMIHKLSCDQASAQALEAWVVSEFRKGNITKLDAAEWLRLLLDLIYEFNKEDCDLFPTRLADTMRPIRSPFSPDAMQSRQRVEQWRDVLHQWITTSSSCTSVTPHANFDKPPHAMRGLILRSDPRQLGKCKRHTKSGTQLARCCPVTHKQQRRQV